MSKLSTAQSSPAFLAEVWGHGFYLFVYLVSKIPLCWACFWWLCLSSNRLVWLKQILLQPPFRPVNDFTWSYALSVLLDHVQVDFDYHDSVNGRSLQRTQYSERLKASPETVEMSSRAILIPTPSSRVSFDGLSNSHWLCGLYLCEESTWFGL